TTPEGRAKAAMNALIHGVRSRLVAERAQDSYSFEDRKARWMCEYDPKTDSQEYLLHKNIELASELDRVGRVGLARRRDRLENFQTHQNESTRVLGNKLFFDPTGAAAVYGQRAARPKPGQPTTSFSGKADDPNDPVKIINELEATVHGCN